MRRRLYIIAASLTIIITLVLLHHHGNPALHQQRLTPANATLGFGTILALSRPHSSRLPSLLWAANLTDLQIEVPPQPNWTAEDLHSFRLETSSQISVGSAQAWLGHLHILRTFLSSGAETALILEDDADYDISIRSHQIPLLASSLRALLPSPHKRRDAFWPHPSTWDILYPGHCDDALPSPFNPLLSHPHTLYTDTTTPPHTVLHPDTSNFLRALDVPEESRILHKALAPLCTVAYAVHRRSAEAIVQRFTREEIGVDAFDVQLLRACAQGWKCWSVSPEVFHHGDGASEIAAVDRGGGEGSGGVRRIGKGTWNVRCGARHGQLWVGEGEGDAREEARGVMREMLMRGDGECPVHLARAERSWRGCEWEECGAQS